MAHLPFKSRAPFAVRAGAADGISLLEITTALSLFVVGVLGTVSVMLSSIKLDATNRETDMARNAARQVIETMKGTTFNRIFATFNSDPADDPSGAGAAPGATFTVRGLRPQSGAPAVGSIVFPTTAGALREDVVDASMGMPLDLNGDGAIDAANHAGDYYVLPVTVRVQWTGANGDRTFTLHTVLYP